MSDKAVYRTALATPGLFIIYVQRCVYVSCDYTGSANYRGETYNSFYKILLIFPDFPLNLYFSASLVSGVAVPVLGSPVWCLV